MPRARRDLRDLDKPIAERVVSGIERFAETEAGNVKHLRGQDGELRLRVGDWRVRFTLDPEQGIMNVLRIRHRREAYRRH
ncbi:MAG: plasmid stabilization protein [Dehalococcoidia bacterium]|nr:plasmid stabilization protein [Dehalococcoidia bacterium]